jgi:SAM-dependent methyltransferase
VGGDRIGDLQDGYDRLAPEYTAHIAGELAHKPFDREILERFAGLTRETGPVFDLGCGPGHVTRHLSDLGVDVTGIDLSSGMVEQALALNPGICFQQGSMLGIDVDGSLGGIVALYSIIHVPRDQQPGMFSRWLAALRPGGHVLIAFHLGESDRHIDELWGIPVSIDFLFFSREEVEGRLVDAGFTILESHERDPYPGVEAETRRAYILAQRPA